MLWYDKFKKNLLGYYIDFIILMYNFFVGYVNVFNKSLVFIIKKKEKIGYL